MGGSISSENAFSGSVGFKSCLYTISSEELCTRNEQKSYGNTEKILKEKLSIEKLEYFTSSSEEEKESNVPIEKLEYSTSSSEEEKESNVPIEKLVYSTSSSEEKESNMPIEKLEYSTSSSEEEKESNDSDVLPGKKYCSLIEDLKIDERSLIPEQRDECNMMKIQPHSFDVGTSNDLIELASELLHLHISSDEEGEVIEEEDTCLEEGNSSSVPTLLSCSKPVSAIKGSRPQSGKVMSEKLRVKWAADVYDPPVTSSSHTVKGRNRHRHHHPRSKKEYYYYSSSSSSSKGKSSKGGGASDRKHGSTHRKSRHGTSALAHESRPRPHESGKTVANTCTEAKTDARVRSKDLIAVYGSSCCMEPLASLPLAVAKVS